MDKFLNSIGAVAQAASPAAATVTISVIAAVVVVIGAGAALLLGYFAKRGQKRRVGRIVADIEQVLAVPAE